MTVRIAILVGGIGRRIGMDKTEVKVCGKKLIELAIEKYCEYETVFVCRDERQVKDLSEKRGDKVYVFNGWTFSSSPSLREFDHPIYDLWLTGCENI